MATGVDDTHAETHAVARINASDVAVDAADVRNRARKRCAGGARTGPASGRASQGVVPVGIDVGDDTVADLQVRLIELELDAVLVRGRLTRGVVLRSLGLCREIEAVGER